MEEKGNGCFVRSYEYPNGKVEVLERSCGDFIETSYVKGVIFNKPGLVAAVGEIPDELKIDGAISFSFAGAPYKYPKTLPGDPVQRRKVMRDAFKDSMDKNLRNFLLGLSKARGNSSGSTSEQSEEKETHSADEERPAMIQVNLAASFLRNPILIKQAMEAKEKEKGEGVKRNFESSCKDCKEDMGNIAHKKARVSPTSICKQDGDGDEDEEARNINQQARTMVEKILAASLAPSTFIDYGGFQRCHINEANFVFHAAAGGAQGTAEGTAEVQGPPHASFHAAVGGAQGTAKVQGPPHASIHAAAGGAQGIEEVQGPRRPPHAPNLQAAMENFNRYFRGFNHCYINKANFVFHAGADGAPSGGAEVKGPAGGGG